MEGRGVIMHLYGLTEPPLCSLKKIYFDELRCDEYPAGSGPKSRRLLSLSPLLRCCSSSTIMWHPPSPSCVVVTPSRDRETMSTSSSLLVSNLFLYPFPQPDLFESDRGKYHPLPPFTATPLILMLHPAPLLTD